MTRKFFNPEGIVRAEQWASRDPHTGKLHPRKIVNIFTDGNSGGHYELADGEVCRAFRINTHGAGGEEVAAWIAELINAECARQRERNSGEAEASDFLLQFLNGYSGQLTVSNGHVGDVPIDEWIAAQRGGNGEKK